MNIVTGELRRRPYTHEDPSIEQRIGSLFPHIAHVPNVYTYEQEEIIDAHCLGLIWESLYQLCAYQLPNIESNQMQSSKFRSLRDAS